MTMSSSILDRYYNYVSADDVVIEKITDSGYTIFLENYHSGYGISVIYDDMTIFSVEYSYKIKYYSFTFAKGWHRVSKDKIPKEVLKIFKKYEGVLLL